MIRMKWKYRTTMLLLTIVCCSIIGCNKKEIPDGISEAVYERGVKSSELLHDVFDKKN